MNDAAPRAPCKKTHNTYIYIYVYIKETQIFNVFRRQLRCLYRLPPGGSFRPFFAIDQDVETVDPVLNPLLNRELQRTGGRTLIRLGSEDIDYSPDFLLLLVTRNPGARFTPDLCSRVTIVNFTVTPASLQSQVRFDGSRKPHEPLLVRLR